MRRRRRIELHAGEAFDLDFGVVAVRAIQDRGDWFLEIGLAREERWYDVDLWEACLDGVDAPAHMRELSSQAQRIRARLPEIRAAVSRGAPELHDCLLARQKRRVLARLDVTEAELSGEG